MELGKGSNSWSDLIALKILLTIALDYGDINLQVHQDSNIFIDRVNVNDTMNDIFLLPVLGAYHSLKRNIQKNHFQTYLQRAQ